MFAFEREGRSTAFPQKIVVVLQAKLVYSPFEKGVNVSCAAETNTIYFSSSLLEVNSKSPQAIACHCPIVASNTPPVLEGFEDYPSGVLVDFFDEGAIASHSAEVLERGDRFSSNVHFLHPYA